jgi:hypothetical protein
MTTFDCDKIDILTKLQGFESNMRISDEFYTGINLSTTINDANFELFGCWNSNGRELLNDFHLNSIHQKNLIDIMGSYYSTQPKSENIRMTFGDNIYYKKDYKKLIIKIKENKELNKELNNLEFNLQTFLNKQKDFTIGGINPLEKAKEIIDNGFNALPTMPTFISLGNNDIEYKYILQYQIHKCMTEMNISDNKVSFGNWILPNAFYSVKFNIKNKAPIIFIFIDTNLLAKGNYTFLTEANRQKYSTLMLSWLTKTLDENKDTLKIVIGHEPIFYYTNYIKKEESTTSIKSLKVSNAATKYLELYKILIDKNISAYMCSHEHNFQWLYDKVNNINHLICGASPGGEGAEVTNTFDDDELYFSTKSSSIPIPDFKDKIIKKMVINAPSFMNMIVHQNLVQINIVSAKNLLFHNKEFCKEKDCKKTDLTKHEIYEIVTIPKYKDYIGVYGCDGYLKTYIEQKCPETKPVNQPVPKSA